MKKLIRKFGISSLLLRRILDGGPGSGFFGHKGREGKVGGSSSSNSLSEPLTNDQLKQLLNNEDIKKEVTGDAAIY